MDEFKNEINKSTDKLKASFQDTKTNSGIDVLSSYADNYAIVSEDEVIKRFKLCLRSGRVYSVPYSLLPVFILLDGKELIMKTYGVHIIVKGRNLATIEEHLSDEVLSYIRESPSRKDDGKAEVFISDIFIRGKAMKYEEDIQNEEA